LLVLSQPESGEIQCWNPGKANVIKDVASRIDLSGTVVTVPFEVYQTVSLKETKVIVEKTSDWLITIHYLGKDPATGVSYHAIKEYLVGVLCLSRYGTIEVNEVIKYTTVTNWGLVLVLTSVMEVVGAVVGNRTANFLEMRSLYR